VVTAIGTAALEPAVVVVFVVVALAIAVVAVELFGDGVGSRATREAKTLFVGPFSIDKRDVHAFTCSLRASAASLMVDGCWTLATGIGASKSITMKLNSASQSMGSSNVGSPLFLRFLDKEVVQGSIRKRSYYWYQYLCGPLIVLSTA